MADPPAYIQNLRNFTRGAITSDDLPRLEAEIYGTNDRASVVMLGAALVKSLMRPDINADTRRILFAHNGPLGTFSSKTATAYAFGGIGPVTHHDIDLIRELRNEFAHSRKSFGFDQKEVADVCAKLELPNRAEAIVPEEFLKFLPQADLRSSIFLTRPKTKFVTSCHTISLKIFQGIKPKSADQFDHLGLP